MIGMDIIQSSARKKITEVFKDEIDKRGKETFVGSDLQWTDSYDRQRQYKIWVEQIQKIRRTKGKDEEFIRKDNGFWKLLKEIVQK